MAKIHNRLVAPVVVLLALVSASCTSAEDDASQTTLSSETSTTAMPDQVEDTSTTESETATPTSEQPSDVVGIECPTGEATKGNITGVFEFANMRSEPSVSGQQITEVVAGSDIAFVADSYNASEERRWIAVVNEDQSCGWVAAEFVKDDSGKLLGTISAEEYVRRALFGLDAEAAHGTYTQDGAEASQVPLDPTALNTTVSALRAIGTDNPGATVRPDGSVEVDDGAPDGVGCIMGDGLFCQVEVLNADEEVIAVISVGRYGDGVTEATIQ